MRRSGFSILLVPLLLSGCSGDPGPFVRESPTGPPQPTEVLIQPVDAGTGAALADGELTIRHLVRFPITLDEAAVERVSSDEAHRIAHETAWDSMVVELRLEAESYHRMDTVLTVPRGASQGPVTLRMARRLSGGDRSSGAAPGPGAGRPVRPAAPSPASDPDAGVDRTALQAGDQAFRSQQWAAATDAYAAMPEPPRRTGTYAREYAAAKIRQGEAHLNRGEYAGAMDALETAMGFQEAPYRGYLLLGQAQCGVGRFDEGRESVHQIERLAPTIPADQWGAARALAAYQRANCTYQEFTRVEAAMDILRVGGAAVREYEAFIQEAEDVEAPPPEVTAAIQTANTRIEEIRERMRTG